MTARAASAVSFQRRLRRGARNEDRPPATHEQLLEKIRRQSVGRLGPADHDEIVVPGAKHDSLQRMAVFFMPAGRHASGAARRAADLDVRTGTEVAKVLRGGRRTGLRLDVQIPQGIRQGGTQRECRMRRVGSGLTRPDMDMEKLQMTRKRPRRGERCLKQRPVGFAATDRDKERLHPAPLTRRNPSLAERRTH